MSVTPAAGHVDGSEPIKASTAILMCIRNEPPDRTIRNITPLLEYLVALGVGRRFHLYLLSDTTDPAIARPEEARFGEFTNAWLGRIEITYRRRRSNVGFKAGNIRDFCDRWGAIHDFAIVLDADSVMTVDAVLRLGCDGQEFCTRELRGFKKECCQRNENNQAQPDQR